jgi:hypothetical protein
MQCLIHSMLLAFKLNMCPSWYPWLKRLQSILPLPRFLALSSGVLQPCHRKSLPESCGSSPCLRPSPNDQNLASKKNCYNIHPAAEARVARTITRKRCLLQHLLKLQCIFEDRMNRGTPELIPNLCQLGPFVAFRARTSQPWIGISMKLTQCRRSIRCGRSLGLQRVAMRDGQAGSVV